MTLRKDIVTMQRLINSGMAWRLEGSVGRAAMDAIRNGDVMLGRDSHRDYYGNRVPGRDDVKPGTKGSPRYVADRNGDSYANELAAIDDRLPDIDELLGEPSEEKVDWI